MTTVSDTTTAQNEKQERAREARLRRLAAKQGYRMTRSRWRAGSVDNFGNFMVVNERNCIVLGERFDATLDDIEAWLHADEDQTDKATH